MSRVTRKVDERARVVLPEVFAGRAVEIEVVAPDEVRIKLKKEPRRRPSARALIARITDKNRHALVDFGPPVGGEIE